MASSETEAGRSAPGRLGSGHGLDTGSTGSTVTNSTGGFSMASLPASEYRIVISMSGLRTASTQFELPEGASVYVDATLTPSGGSGVIAVPIPY